jgi:hypothetical protein
MFEHTVRPKQIGRHVRRARTESTAVPEREGLALIALAVVALAVEDARSEVAVLRDEAQAFLADEDFRTWCEIAGLAPGRTRAALLGVERS